MQLETFTADIIVDGKALEQYDVVYETPTKATCWVASEEGKSFSVKWDCREVSHSTGNQGSVNVDGIRCGRHLSPPGSLSVGNPAVLSHFVSGTVERELMFARVELSDDDSLLHKEIVKKLGEICLVIGRGEIVMERRAVSRRDLSMLDDNKFHERSKKAAVHCVGFGPEMARIPALYRGRLKLNNEPKLTFVFKYQPLSMLQANGIAPRSTPNTTADDFTTDIDLEDIKPAQLNDRIQGLENELKRLRDLQDRNSDDPKPKRIKKEDRSRPLFAPGEIIDLT